LSLSTSFSPSVYDGAIFGICHRNREAEKIIGNYAEKHQWLDIGIGLIGTFSPIPGSALAAMAACMVAQGPVFYGPMAKDLSAVYLSSIDKHTKRLVNETWLDGIGADLANQFVNVEFFQEIIGEVISELGWAGVATAIPFIGGVFGAALDALVAATMTWRVGTMISVYYQNGGAWLEGRRETFEVAKDFVGPLSAKAKDRINLDDVVKKRREILEKQFSTLKSVLLDSLLEITSDEKQIIHVLNNRQISEELIDFSLPYIRSELRKKHS
jgi:uncharacterized protein (DUF697 family)